MNEQERRAPRAIWTLIFIATIVVAGGGAWFWNRSGDEPRDLHSNTGGRTVGASSLNERPVTPVMVSPSTPVVHDSPALRADAPVEPNLIAQLFDALKDPSEDSRRRRFLELIEKMRPEDGPAVRELFGRLSEQGLRFPLEWAAFWRRWGLIDPEGALQFADAGAKESGDGRIYERMFQGWANGNAEGALQWLKANGGHAQFEHAFVGFLDVYAKKDLDAATRITLDSLAADDPLLGRSLSKLAENAFNTRSARGMQEWFDRYVPKDQSFANARKQTIGQAYKQLLQVNLETAAQWVGDQSRDQEVPRNFAVIDDLAIRYSRVNPEAAMNWVASLPPNKEPKYIGVGRVVGEWARQDSSALEAWLTSNRESPIFETVASDYAGYLAGRDAGRARQWAEQISDPKMRSETLQKLQKAAEAQQK